MEQEYSITVDTRTSDSTVKHWWEYDRGTTTANFTYPTSTWYYSSPIYMYQVFCPVRKCKTANWLQLDTMKPCTNCGAKLKAVSSKADYEVEVK